MSCYTQSFCVGTGYDIHANQILLVVFDNGVTTQIPVPDSDILSAVTCIAATTCIVVGSQLVSNNVNSLYQGLVLVTTDGGNTWTQGTVPSTVYGLNGISCPSISNCVAVGRYNGPDGTVPAAATSTDGGLTWTVGSTPDVQHQMTAVSCRTDLECVAVGGTGQVADSAFLTSDGGSTWTTEPITGMETVTSVSCGASTCVASGVSTQGYGGIATSFDGGIACGRVSLFVMRVRSVRFPAQGMATVSR